MKNIEKWANVQKTVVELSKRTPIEAKETDLQSRKKHINMLNGKVMKQEKAAISIEAKTETIQFSSDNFGSFIEVIFKRRRRLNVLPICFLVQLYNEQLEIADETGKNELNILFDLKSFWKMQKAVDMIHDLTKIMLNQKLLLQNIERNSFLEEQHDSINVAMNQIDSLKIMPPENGKIEVHFSGAKFTLNTKNVKLDIVPLCKMLVKYYVQFVVCMNNVCETFEDVKEKQKIWQSEYVLEKFMTRYFTSGKCY